MLVFAFGFVRLWRSNRTMRRLELLDEEKRARTSVISHCGIEALRPPEIPFGIRALKHGIQVEGIWISRPNTPESRHTAPLATPVASSLCTPKGKGKLVDPSYSDLIGEYPASTNSRTVSATFLDLSCRAPSTLPAESPQSGQTVSTHQSRPGQVTPKARTQRNPLMGVDDQNRTGNHAQPGFRNPFFTPARTSRPSSNKATAASTPESPTAGLGSYSLTETRVDRYAARVCRGDAVVPTGARLHGHARKAYSEGSSPYRLGMLPTPTKETLDRNRKR